MLQQGALDEPMELCDDSDEAVAAANSEVSSFYRTTSGGSCLPKRPETQTHRYNYRHNWTRSIITRSTNLL